MRTQSSACLPLLFVFPLVLGCDQVSNLLHGPGPENTLTGYLNATIRGDWEGAYGYLSSQDQAVRSLSEYKRESSTQFATVFAEKKTYMVVEVKEHGDTATAQVDITLPDLRGMFADLLGSAFASAFRGANQKEIERRVAEKYGNEDLPTTTKREEFTLIREPEGWRVFLDLETKGKISTLLTEAKQLKEQKKLHAALDKYNQLLELDSEVVEAKDARVETSKEIKEFEEKQEYIERVVLYDLEARYHDTYIEKQVPGVNFKVKNTGDRTLNKVEVTVYFKDASGSIIAEEDYHPVLVTTYSFSFRDNKPLKPNYIWQMERGKFYKAESVPSEWKEGAVSAQITDIEFAE